MHNVTDDDFSLSISSQSSFRNLKVDQYIEIDFDIIIGSRLNSKLIFSKEEKQLYRFNTMCGLGSAYKCRISACNARVYLINENTCIKLDTGETHSHGDQFISYRELQAFNEMKRRCVDLKYVLAGNRITVREIFNAVSSEYNDVRLDFFKHERTLQIIRNKAFPSSPKDCEEISAKFNQENVMNSIGVGPPYRENGNFKQVMTFN